MLLDSSDGLDGPFGITIFTDTDSDARADELDLCPLDANKVALGQCGCGVPDTDSDSDGTANCNDTCGSDPLKLNPGICGCGTTDIDSDSDGTADCNESCDNDAKKTQAGVCGCGVADTDSDLDGQLDCNESCDNDKNKTVPGVCGCGTADVDLNKNGTFDCTDIAFSLTKPKISVLKPNVIVKLPSKAGISFQYTYKFVLPNKKIKQKTATARSGAKLRVSIPRNAVRFKITYIAKGQGYSDFTSPEYSKTF